MSHEGSQKYTDVLKLGIHESYFNNVVLQSLIIFILLTLLHATVTCKLLCHIACVRCTILLQEINCYFANYCLIIIRFEVKHRCSVIKCDVVLRVIVLFSATGVEHQTTHCATSRSKPISVSALYFSITTTMRSNEK